MISICQFFLQADGCIHPNPKDHEAENDIPLPGKYRGTHMLVIGLETSQMIGHIPDAPQTVEPTLEATSFP